jgi:hypothetical protein
MSSGSVTAGCVGPVVPQAASIATSAAQPSMRAVVLRRLIVLLGPGLGAWDRTDAAASTLPTGGAPDLRATTGRVPAGSALETPR